MESLEGIDRKSLRSFDISSEAFINNYDGDRKILIYPCILQCWERKAMKSQQEGGRSHFYL